MTTTARAAGIRMTLALGAAVPAIITRSLGISLAPEAATLVFGAAVVGSAFILAWAGEAAQVDISGSLATAVLAVVATLPEYGVDLFFAVRAGHDQSQAQYAAANMTGSNRLLIGIGWPLVAFVAYAASRRRGGHGKDRGRGYRLRLEGSSRVEVGYLGLASVFAFVIVAAGALAWWCSAVMLGIFALYLWRLSGEKRSEPALTGTAAVVGSLGPARRRATVSLLFLAAVVTVLVSAGGFAEGLVGTGTRLGIDQFFLVQWLGPLATEAPELIVAGLFAWRSRAGDALRILMSSKVNQWTLLVGSLPIGYLAGGGHYGLPLDARQTEELLLTATQALLGLAVVMDLSLRVREAVLLLGLFLVQFVLPGTTARVGLSVFYGLIATVIVVANRRHVPAIARASGPRRAAKRSLTIE